MSDLEKKEKDQTFFSIDILWITNTNLSLSINESLTLSIEYFIYTHYLSKVFLQNYY
jgi:hypothetical protein